MQPHQVPSTVQRAQISTLVVLKRDLADWSSILERLESRYSVASFANADRCLRHIEARRVALVLLDAELSSKELFRAIRARHKDVPILCVTGSHCPSDLVEARARDYQFHTFGPDDSRRSLVEVIDSLISPRAYPRIEARECALELPTESGSYAEFQLLDISNQGCAFEARLDPNGNPFVPNTFFPDIRIRSGSIAVLSGVGARVMNVRPLGSDPPGSAPRFRVGVAFSIETANRAQTSGEILDEQIDILALLTNAMTRSPWHVNFPFLETQGMYCEPRQVDPIARTISMEAVGVVPFEFGDVLSVSVEIAGIRYSFYAAVQQASCAGAFSLRLPSTIRAETHRSSMRYRPADGQVELTFQTPFGDAPVHAKIIDITARGAGFLIDSAQCVCPVGTILNRVTMRFSDGVDWHGRARVMSLRPSRERQGNVRCGIEFDISQPNEQHNFVERLTKATRPRMGGASDVSASVLWQFFRDSGFLYPEKLESLSEGAAVDTLSKVLVAPPSLTHSFVYRTRDNQIGAHMSASKVYPRTWELQHLAGRQNASVSLMVPELILGVSEYMEQLEDIDWCRMFFRPNNGWPAYAIGDYVARLGTEQSADITQYAYMVLEADGLVSEDSQMGIEVRSYEDDDAPHIADHYVSRGKTTLMQSLQLNSDDLDLHSLDHEYAEIGLGRQREVAVAADSAGFRGFCLMEFSSMGLNLSELTSSFTLNCAEGDTEALLALAGSVARRYRVSGHRRAICLADDWQVEALGQLGFVRTKDYTCVTWPRRFYRRFHQHAQRKFVR